MPASVPVQYGHGGSLSHDMQQALQQPSRGRTTLSIAQALKCDRRRPRLRTERGTSPRTRNAFRIDVGKRSLCEPVRQAIQGLFVTPSVSLPPAS